MKFKLGSIMLVAGLSATLTSEAQSVPDQSSLQESMSFYSDNYTCTTCQFNNKFNAEDYSMGPDGYISSSSDYQSSYFDDVVEQYAYHHMESRRATGHSTLIFSPKKLRWFAYDGNGNFVGSGRASGGRAYCPDVHRGCRTPVGTFTVNSMGDASCYSSKFPIGRGGAPMPYCMFFRGGFAVHGSYEVPNYNASHGCIRVEPAAARWLRYNVMHVGSTVIVEPY